RLRRRRYRFGRVGLVGDRQVEIVVGIDALDRRRPVGNGEVDADADVFQCLLHIRADLAVLGEPAGGQQVQGEAFAVWLLRIAGGVEQGRRLFGIESGLVGIGGEELG